MSKRELSSLDLGSVLTSELRGGKSRTNSNSSIPPENKPEDEEMARGRQEPCYQNTIGKGGRHVSVPPSALCQS